MKPKLLLCLALVLVAGCATQKDDARLQGTWCLNRAATMAVSSNAPPHVVWVTYKHYRVVEHGSNYVVIRTTAPQDKRRDIHIRFVDADTGYWIDSGSPGFGIQERFDRFAPNPGAKPDVNPALSGMGGLIPPQPISIDQ